MATRRDAGTELEYAAQLINEIVAGFEDMRTGIHVCRGNWSRREDVLLTGDYAPLVPAFQQMNLDQYVLEYATPRAGDVEIVGKALGHKQIGLGVVNPRTDEAESVDLIVSRVRKALDYFSPENIFLNPDCGFGCFADRCVNDHDTAVAKLKNMVLASRVLQDQYA